MLHIDDIREGQFVQRFRRSVRDARPQYLVARTRALMRQIGELGHEDRGQGDASWLQGAVGHQSQAIDTSAGN